MSDAVFRGIVGSAVVALFVACGSDKPASPAPEPAPAEAPVAEAAGPKAPARRSDLGRASIRTAKPTRTAARTAPVTPPPAGYITVVDGEPDDAPHVDRALRAIVERDGDMVSGPGFTLTAVPDDITVYSPVIGRRKSVYVAFDAAMEHVATLTVTPARTAPPKPLTLALDKAEVTITPIETFPIWASSFAASQKKRGAGKRHTFRSHRWTYQVDTLVDLPWLLDGWERTDLPAAD